jgi:RimJ/RimL family protein N-acetyltransferase
MKLINATAEYCGWLNDPEVNRYLATKSATLDELKSYIKQKEEQKDALFFGIFNNDNDEHIGTIKLEPIDLEKNMATIAIMIGNKDYWGRGIAGEAMKLLIEYCFNDLKLNEVNLGVIGQNHSAIKAYLKLGFKEVKREYNKINQDGKLFDQVTMVLKKFNYFL